MRYLTRLKVKSMSKPEELEAEIVTEETINEMSQAFHREKALADVVILLDLFNKYIHSNEFIKSDMYLSLRSDDARDHFTQLYNALNREVG